MQPVGNDCSCPRSQTADRVSTIIIAQSSPTALSAAGLPVILCVREHLFALQLTDRMSMQCSSPFRRLTLSLRWPGRRNSVGLVLDMFKIPDQVKQARASLRQFIPIIRYELLTKLRQMLEFSV